jgi:hypothetical protein
VLSLPGPIADIDRLATELSRSLPAAMVAIR